VAFSGGDEAVVARWLENFARSHAKREDPRAEAVVEAGEGGTDARMGVRVRVGERVEPAPDRPPLALAFAEVAARRGDLAWCAALAARVRDLARQAGRPGARTPA